MFLLKRVLVSDERTSIKYLVALSVRTPQDKKLTSLYLVYFLPFLFLKDAVDS